jgi:hypothetical protein
MVKSIKLQHPAKISPASQLGSRVTIARTVPLNTNKAQSVSRRNKQENIASDKFKLVVDQPAMVSSFPQLTANSAGKADNLVLRDQIVDMIARSIVLLQSSDYSHIANRNAAHTTFAPASFNTSPQFNSVEALIGAMDRALDTQVRGVVAQEIRPVSLFSSIHSSDRDTLFDTSTLKSDNFASKISSSARDHPIISSDIATFLVNRVSGQSSSLPRDLASLIVATIEFASQSSSKDHERRPQFGKRIDSSFIFSSKHKGVNISYQETRRVLTGLGGLVEDSYGSGPLRYQQDMENGPPTSTHSSNPRELGES